ncbi:MAG: hypothetical protein IJM79_00060 [Erysipelotrichaceae bacterium]|nr:hypothetical protein [Erysipelotrichaceae bacterium]
MKKITLAFIAILMVCLLAGCGDAHGKLTNGNQPLFTIGKTKVTKNDFYEVMRDYDSGDYLIKQTAKYIVNAEIETTDEITAEARKQFDETVAGYDDLAAALKALGYASEEELMEDVVDSVKSDRMIDKYIEDNWDDLTAKYAPLKVRVLSFETEENETADFKERAAAALAELKAGETFDAVAKKYMDESSDAYKLAAEALYTTATSGYDTIVSEYLKTVTTPGLSEVLTDNTGTKAFVVQVTNNNLTQLKNDFVSYLKGLSSITQDMYTFYFKKHNFTIYDIDLYNLIKTNYASYLVQDN